MFGNIVYNSTMQWYGAIDLQKVWRKHVNLSIAGKTVRCNDVAH